MTGFGRGEATYDGTTFVSEIKSLNNRYNEVFVNAPKDCLEAEYKVAKKIKQEFSRGKFDVSLSIEEGVESSVQLDEKAVIEAWKRLEKLRKTAKQASPILVEAVIPLLKNAPRTRLNPKKRVSMFLEATDAAIQRLKASREAEGRMLAKVIRMRITLIQKSLQKIRHKVTASGERKSDLLWGKISKILEKKELDRKRVETEIAILLEKSDITEEIDRFTVHLRRFSDTMQKAEPIGREIDFLIQEMNREVNTIGAKSGDYEISDEVIFVKAELEKIREQIQNIE